MSAVLSFQNATRAYGSGHLEVSALRDVSLDVEAGEFIAVMGPSGSGKSTLLALAGGLDRPTAGRVLFGESELAGLAQVELARLRRQRIGYVFQDRNLLGQLTAAENVALPLELGGTRPRRAHAMARQMLDELGLGDLGERFPETLSGGEQQRVAVARALVGERRCLLADEPTASLDSLNGEEVVRLLRQRCDAGATAIMVTHDTSFAGWADRVVFLRDGRLVDTTEPAPGVKALLDGVTT